MFTDYNTIDTIGNSKINRTIISVAIKTKLVIIMQFNVCTHMFSINLILYAYSP